MRKAGEGKSGILPLTCTFYLYFPFSIMTPLPFMTAYVALGQKGRYNEPFSFHLDQKGAFVPLLPHMLETDLKDA